MVLVLVVVIVFAIIAQWRTSYSSSSLIGSTTLKRNNKKTDASSSYRNITNGTTALKKLEDIEGTTVIREPSADEEKCEEARRHYYHSSFVVANNDTTPSSNSKKKICLVHLGKTAGSTITCMMNHSVQHSGKGNSRCDDIATTPTTNRSVTAIAKYVTQRIHLEPAPAVNNTKFDSFLITLRNPIDRIISWYYYLHPNYLPPKLPRHKAGCDNFAFFQCWPTLQEFTNIGLDKSRENKDDDDDDKTIQCKTMAKEIATGARHCWHNYWNFNRTYSPLLQAAATDDVRQRPEIFAIRTEHTWEDWQIIDKMLGGTGKLDETPITKNQFTSEYRNKTLDGIGRNNLCHALCEEIQIYKRLLILSRNLCPVDKQQSIQECQNEVPYVRHCQ